ncbi:MAG: HD domain-containing phosphohydrolase [Bacillota bacterium]
MRLVPVAHLKHGSKIALDILNAFGMPLISAEEIVTMHTLQTLHRLKISYVYIKDEYCFQEKSTTYGISQVGHFMKIIYQLREIALRSMKGESGPEDIEDCVKVAKKLVAQVVPAVQDGTMKIMYEPVKMYTDTVIEQSIYVSIMSVALGVKMNMSEDKLVELCIAGMLRNFALLSPKIRVNGKLLKPAQIEEMHPTLTYNFLKNNYDISEDILLGILHHHEQHDGSGYPGKLNGSVIHPYARILSLIQFFYTLKTDNNPLVVKQGLLEVVFESKLKKFHPDVVDVFLANVELFTLDTLFRLTTGDIVAVLKNNPFTPFKPVVRVVKSGGTNEVGTVLDLCDFANAKIKINTIVYYIDEEDTVGTGTND